MDRALAAKKIILMRYDHTPGPWAVTYKLGIFKISARTNHCIATVEDYPRQRSPKSNARLISAAPDLFHALQTVSKLSDEAHWGPVIWKEINEALQKACNKL
jgi:hypothetical protein